MLNRSIQIAVCSSLLMAGSVFARAENGVPAEAKAAFEVGNYGKAIEILNHAAAAAPKDAAVQHLLARCYFENEQYDRAIPAAETSVSISPNDSAYHELLGRAYGEKADRSGWFSALSLAKKARREFEIAVKLDERNFSAMQALIEFDCSAPGVAGGGEDKARPEIEKLRTLDAAEGMYAEGNCRRQKKDFAAADERFRQTVAMNPKSADLLFDIGDYYMKRGQPDQLLQAVDVAGRLAPADPRGPFFRGVALTLRRQYSADAAKLIDDYVAKAPKRNNYPSKAMAHYWLGQIQESKNDHASARREYQEALKLEPKNRFASDALKRLQRD